MKTPPLLLGAALVFWGWQTGFMPAGVVMALILEASRWVRTRWDFSDDDFRRIWTFCTLLFLGAAVYAFTDNGGPSRFGNLLQNSTVATLNGAGAASARTASAILRWLPMVIFFFMAAQAYSSRTEIPLTTISLIVRRRWRKALRRGWPMPEARGLNASYPYFAVCLFAASIHPSETNTYFWGLCGLLAWALWAQRSRRFGAPVWAGMLALSFVLGYFGQHGIGQLQSYIQNLDPQWLVGFMHRRVTDPAQSRTALGDIGHLKLSGRIVIRVETDEDSQPPTYLREASYRLFSAGVWKVTSYKDDFDSVPYGNTNTTWLLLPEKTNTTRVHITCYLEGRVREPESPAGLLPLPTGCGRLEGLPVFTLKKNRTGAVLAEGPGLVMFDAFYGPGATIDAPPFPVETNEDLSVPVRELPALDQVISELGVTNGNTSQAMRAITRFFESNFTYSVWQRAGDFSGEESAPRRFSYKGRAGWASTNETPLARFLLHTQSGHCEYFATATVLLLRRMGIPARYAVGYVVHEPSSSGYVVRLRDAHSWCQVWNNYTQTWRDFDTTPPSWLEDEAKQASPFQKWSDVWSWMELQFAKFRWGQSNIRQYLLMTLFPVLALLLYQIFFRRHRRRKVEDGRVTPTAWPGLDSEFYLIERKLSQRGIRRQPDEPLAAWLRRAQADPALAEAGDSLRQLLQLHYRYRFDPRGLTRMDRAELKQKTQSALADLDRKTARPRT